MRLRGSLIATIALAATALGGCGSDAPDAAAPPASTRARAALEQSVMSSVRVTPGLGSVASARCARRDAGGRRWSCRLAGDHPQDITVTVNDSGWWTANDVRAAAAPQMGPDGAHTGDFTSGAAFTGCCVPLD